MEIDWYWVLAYMLIAWMFPVMLFVLVTMMYYMIRDAMRHV